MKLSQSLQVLPALLLLAMPVARAQQQQPSSASPSGAQAPLPPLGPETNDATENAGTAAPAAIGLSVGSNASGSQAVPDTHVLSDSEAFGLGQLQGPHNIFTPSLHFTEGGDTGITPGITTAFTLLGGSLALERFWERYDFRLDYDGGDTIYIPYGSPNSFSYHNLGVSQFIRGQRWNLDLNDALSYAPQATFGGLNLGGPGSQGFQTPTGLEPSASPNQTILTGFAPRLQETAAGDLNYQLNSAATLTFSGSGGLLHFTNTGYIDSYFYSARIGYNYSLNTKDSLAITDVYSGDTYNAYNYSIRSDTVLFSYGRKMTGKLAFQVGAGPEFIDSLIAGSSSFPQWSWSAFSSLTYQWQRTDLLASYSRTLSNGSGIYLGSEVDSISGTLDHRFTPVWSGAVYGGYSLNATLSSTSGIANQFQFWTGGANLTRNLGRVVDVIFGYGFTWQGASGGACPITPSGGCGALNYTRSVGSVTVNWHMIPIRFE